MKPNYLHVSILYWKLVANSITKIVNELIVFSIGPRAFETIFLLIWDSFKFWRYYIFRFVPVTKIANSRYKMLNSHLPSLFFLFNFTLQKYLCFFYFLSNMETNYRLCCSIYLEKPRTEETWLCNWLYYSIYGTCFILCLVIFTCVISESN